MAGRKSSSLSSFWWHKPDWRAFLLSPLAALYDHVASRRIMQASPPHIALPVLCIGNFTVGGAGKTPTCIAFAQAAKAEGLVPGIVSRGYGGSFKDVHLVDAGADNAALTGDEPLLLAHYAKVAVSPDRYKAAQLLQQQGCDFIIMDDGFQSARLFYDYALVVVDAVRGIGNGRVIPAGPLRAALATQFQKASALLRITPDHQQGADASENVIRMAARANKPFFDAKLVSVARQPVKDKKFLCFAGIGNPQKFYASVAELGGEVVESRSFGDHYQYKPQDIGKLLADARAAGLQLATTAKDFVRLRALRPAIEGNWLSEIAVFDVRLDFGREKILQRIIRTTRQNYLDRSLEF
ncbi:tetraacyldisaccharide 4'-kinase [Pseudochrobactrum sp. HB0163]|uniref:tetraacyldisaccharide 4'-kinase n=1 Tax=Pseudochrobactrum sp. HB0163 TaxID=3450708 RepID=UPI003F6DD588